MTPTIDEIETSLGIRLPAAYRAFLANHPDDVAYDDVQLYGRSSFVEMNECHAVQRFCPGSVTIGDDGGGRQFMLNLDAGRLFLVDAGSLHPDDAVAGVPEDFAVWLATGCPLPVENEPAYSASDLVAVYVEQPLKSLKTLVIIKEHLALSTSIGELKKQTQETPYRVADHLTYMQAIHACAKVNAVEPCLGIRALRDSAVRLPLVWQD